ncbi:MAG: hypothetical protein PQJ45_06525 [Sphaerochaetaceae bacterium]|nr:hypothetical protein [Sphaerochaetaceae bacterium]
MKKFNLFIGITAIVIGFSSCTTVSDVVQNEIKDDQLYLESVYNIDLYDTSIDLNSFIESAKDISGKDISLSKDVIEALVKAADFEELALTYSDEKASSRLDYYGVKKIGDFDAKYVACALDAKLITSSDVSKLVKEDSIDGDVAATLLMNIAQVNGVSRNYIGNISDDDILNKVASAFNSYYIYSDNNLDVVGKELVKSKASTGYNLKKEGFNSNFISELTIKYGHSDEKHLKQLIALLNSEGIDAKLQIEPKVSIYQYLLEWGPIPEPSYSYFVEQYSEDLYLVNALEYDALFEFESEADLLDFNRIIEQYSKKNSENQKEGSDVKLISGAWWQPLYSTTVMYDEQAYQVIYDSVATEGGYSIHPFCLEENKDELSSIMQSYTDAPVVLNKMFVNNAFYRYLSGEGWE